MAARAQALRTYHPRRGGRLLLVYGIVIFIGLSVEYVWYLSGTHSDLFGTYVLPVLIVLELLLVLHSWLAFESRKHLPTITIYSDRIEAYCPYCKEVSTLTRKEITATKVVGKGSCQRILIAVKDPERHIRAYSKNFVQKSHIQALGAYVLMKLRGQPVRLRQFYSGNLEDQIQVYLMNVQLNEQKTGMHFCIPVGRYRNAQHAEVQLIRDLQGSTPNS